MQTDPLDAGDGDPPALPTFLLVPGAGGAASYWHRVVDELRRRGHEPVAVDLPAGDEECGLAEYADAIVAAVGHRDRVILVAQSMGAFSAPLVCDRVAVELIVLVNGMVPRPGETAGAWWSDTGNADARRAQAEADGRSLDDEDMVLDVFFHDVPADVTATAMAAGELPQADRPFTEPWPLAQWPAVPTRALVGADDRLFPAAFQRRILAERLGVTPDVMPGGHLVALSRPVELVDHLEAYAGVAAQSGQPETSAR